MTFEEITAYPVPPITAGNAHLYLWVTNPHLPFVWEIVAAWGFEYRTMITWAKPPEFYEIVERASYGPYCELFARQAREGWKSFGDEL